MPLLFTLRLLNRIRDYILCWIGMHSVEAESGNRLYFGARQKWLQKVNKAVFLCLGLIYQYINVVSEFEWNCSCNHRRHTLSILIFLASPNNQF